MTSKCYRCLILHLMRKCVPSRVVDLASVQYQLRFLLVVSVQKYYEKKQTIEKSLPVFIARYDLTHISF